MLNIEKYKDDILEKYESDITCCVRYVCLGEESCMDDCSECKKHAMQWLLSEYKEPILNKAEREYLSAVIKPFRDEVKFINLPSYDCPNLTYTCIRMYDNCGNKIVRLPIFKRGTMYKGMKLDKNYTLEELGL